ncbi:MAG: serine--tRNA ligase, partial [Paracoccus sp. (in: a-proteobacteria)]|nr:serine--tRNA ligase [Paracoccus sp. (in: a-proteobacteria)]
MHDIRTIRENPDAFDAALGRRGLSPVTPQILALDADRRARIAEAETAQSEVNKISKQAGAAKGRGDEAEFEALRAQVTARKDDVNRMQAEAAALDEQLRDFLLTIPNLPLDNVPVGADENDNVEIRRWGTP